jgi:23S rRNA (uracil1939-C5)-methyltransferase
MAEEGKKKGPDGKGKGKGKGKGGWKGKGKGGSRGSETKKDRRGRKPPRREGQVPAERRRAAPSERSPETPPPGVRLADVEQIEVTVEKLVAGGDGLARFAGVPLFVPRSAPGDRLRVRVTDRRPDYGRAEIVEVLAPGPGRRQAPCPYFERCGGCDLQHLEDGLQSRLKAEAVVETLERLGGVRLAAPPEVLTAGHWGYRLRTQLHTRRAADGGVEAGYFGRGSHELVPVAACPILVPELEALLPGLPSRLGGSPPRRLDLAAGGVSGRGARRTAGTGAADRGAGEPAALTTAPVVEGLPHGEVSLSVELPGPGGHRMERFEYAYDARCFFQAHRDLVARLAAVAVGDWRGEAAYDLYAGVGLFALPLARRYARVTAVEGDAVAARYARRNARSHGLDNLEVEHLALESWIGHLPADADRVVVDPPRGGLGRKLRDALLERLPRRLTYVSCHPATLARDLRHLSAAYRLESLTLFDMFPQSGHMEAVAQLERI